MKNIPQTTSLVDLFRWRIKQSSQNITEDEIIACLREKIAGFKCPKNIKFINEIPCNPTGKVLRKDLREPYWKGKQRNVS
tara:strand:+ start:383 stop:622 length:240 start_codon:yes stop_codon:yes gene_type:complete